MFLEGGYHGELLAIGDLRAQAPSSGWQLPREKLKRKLGSDQMSCSSIKPNVLKLNTKFLEDSASVMLPESIVAVAADAAVAVAAAAAAAADQGRRPSRSGGLSFVDDASYSCPEALSLEASTNCLSHSADDSKGGALHLGFNEKEAADRLTRWRYMRLLSGHWSPWTVTLMALKGRRLPQAALKEFRLCSNLSTLHLESCGVASTVFFSGLPSLRRLLLPHNELSSLRGLKELPKLEELYLKGNPIATFKIFTRPRDCLPGFMWFAVRQDLAQLTGLPSLRRLDLQAIDGSDRAPVCGQRGYQEAVLALLPRELLARENAHRLCLRHLQRLSCATLPPLWVPAGTGGLGTRLEILDGQRLQLPALGGAAAEVTATARKVAETNSRFKAEIQKALEPAGAFLSPRKEKVAPSSLFNYFLLGGGDSQQQLAGEQLASAKAPAEACKAFSERLSEEVKQELANAQTVMQHVRKISMIANRCAFAARGLAS